MIHDSDLQKLIDPELHSDAAELGCLLARYQEQLLAYARRHIPQHMRSVLEPQDVLQDTLFEAFRRLKEFDARDTDSASRWLMTIARNCIINAVKAHGAIKRGGGRVIDAHNLITPNGDSLVSMLAEMAVYARTPSQSAIAHELAAELESSICRLPPDYQQAIRMRYIDAEDVETIALALGRTSRAVHMVCNRALKALRQELRSESRFG